MNTNLNINDYLIQMNAEPVHPRALAAFVAALRQDGCVSVHVSATKEMMQLFPGANYRLDGNCVQITIAKQ